MATASPRGPMYKLVLLGELGVGKTSIFRRLKDDDFDEAVTTTTGIDSCTKVVNVRGQTVTLSIWDTAGVERFRTLTRNYYRGAHATVFVYSVEEPSSLHYLTSWVRDAESFASQATKILIGNKCDLDMDIDEGTSKSFATTHDFALSYLTSAKTNEGINEAFTAIAERLHRPGAGATQGGASSDNPVTGNVDLTTRSPASDDKCTC